MRRSWSTSRTLTRVRRARSPCANRGSTSPAMSRCANAISRSASRKACGKASASASPARARPASATGRPATCISRSRSRNIRCTPSRAVTFTSTCRSRPGKRRSAARCRRRRRRGPSISRFRRARPAAESSGSRAAAIPGKSPGDLYAVLNLTVPPADSDKAKELYRQMARELDYDPRERLGA